jgi:peptidoglycan hydrolase-like protein with peptidoglycan-binding domain
MHNLNKWVKESVWDFRSKTPNDNDAWITLALKNKTGISNAQKAGISNAQDAFVIQSALAKLGFKPWKIDGIFRTTAQKNAWTISETMKAVTDFQKANKLISTNGQVWKETINALIEQLANYKIPAPAVAVKPTPQGVNTSVTAPAFIAPSKTPVSANTASSIITTTWLEKR